MKKLLIIPGAIAILAGIASFTYGIYNTFYGSDGTAALHLIFTFTDIFVGSVLIAIALQD